MEFRENAEIFTAGNEKVGDLERVVLDPQTKEVSHLVVRQGFIFTEDKLVPLNLVAAAAEERIVLREGAGELDELPPYLEEQFIPLDEVERNRIETAAVYGAPLYPYIAYPIPATQVVDVKPNIPANTVALAEGAKVFSADGEHVGDVERLLTDAQTDRVTHLVISQGLILKERKLLPVDWISLIESEEIFLAVGTTVVERLRPYEE